VRATARAAAEEPRTRSTSAPCAVAAAPPPPRAATGEPPRLGPPRSCSRPADDGTPRGWGPTPARTRVDDVPRDGGCFPAHVAPRAAPLERWGGGGGRSCGVAGRGSLHRTATRRSHDDPQGAGVTTTFKEPACGGGRRARRGGIMLPDSWLAAPPAATPGGEPCPPRRGGGGGHPAARCALDRESGLRVPHPPSLRCHPGLVRRPPGAGRLFPSSPAPTLWLPACHCHARVTPRGVVMNPAARRVVPADSRRGCRRAGDR